MPPSYGVARLWYSLAAMTTPLKYLGAYSDDTRHQVQALLNQNRLGEVLKKRYPKAHEVRNDKALYDYVQDLRDTFLRNAALHTSISRIQGGKLKAKHEIRVATMFRECPIEFLRMIAVHELAHVKEKQHDKAFYKLCSYMEPHYHQYEFDVRLYLTELEHSGTKLW
jgi:predicted metal-dependent hydrolase